MNRYQVIHWAVLAGGLLLTSCFDKQSLSKAETAAKAAQAVHGAAAGVCEEVATLPTGLDERVDRVKAACKRGAGLEALAEAWVGKACAAAGQ